jgi:endonuclease/exonuclease/phosphatase family metal-dependent hydrolase
VTISRAKKRQQLKWRKLALFLNMIAGALLLLSILASYVSPAVAWALAFFGIAYPYFLVLNIVFVLYWMVVRRREFLFSLAIILLGYSNLRNQLQLNLVKAPKIEAEKAFKILSFNTRLFDLYNWTKRPDTKQRIFELIKTEDPEIVCIQEFYTSETKPGFNNLKDLKTLRKKTYVHAAYTDTTHGNAYWGIATFSKYPIVRQGNILFNEVTNNVCIYSDLKINNDTVRVYNAHFQSNRLRREDYEFLGNPKQEKEKLNASKNILKRIRTGTIKRSKQVDVVAHHMENSPYPVIICGDFNDPPSSYTYNRLRDNLKDAFVESGFGFGNTYNGLIPLLRIDYILHDKRFNSNDFKIIEEDLSDHFPVSCRLQLKR